MATGLFIDRLEFVEELTSQSLENLKIQENGEHSWCIAFYSASCGHCQNFAPIWNEFARQALQDMTCKVGAINCDVHREICSTFSVKGVPHLLMWEQDDVPTKGLPPAEKGSLMHEGQVENMLQEARGYSSYAKSNNQSNLGFQQQIGLDFRQQGQLDHLPENMLSKDSMVVDRAPTKAEIVADAKTAVRFGLETGIFMGRYTLSSEEHGALLAWLKLLQQSFPGEQNRVQLAWFRDQLVQHKSKVLTSQAWDDLLARWAFGVDDHRTIPVGKRIGSDVFLSSTHHNVPKWSWKFCGTEVEGVHHGGYPCGLWLLFHQLTVTTTARPSRTAAAKRRGMPASPVDTAAAIHGFIKNFFSCETCRLNFVASNPTVNSFMDRDTILPPGGEWGDGTPAMEPLERRLILWAWQEHNAVSSRLNAERLDDEKAAKEAKNPDESIALLLPYTWRAPFPTREMCQGCPLAEKQELQGAGVGGGPNAAFRAHETGHRWSLENVLKFLVDHYCISDSEMICPRVIALGESNVFAPAKRMIRGSGDGDISSSSSSIWLVVFLLLGVIAWFKRELFMLCCKSGGKKQYRRH